MKGRKIFFFKNKIKNYKMNCKAYNKKYKLKMMTRKLFRNKKMK